MSANVETMAYVGETPWHGLGNKVEANLTAEEMAVAAGLNWGVDVRQVYYYHGGKLHKDTSNHRVLVRDDRNEVLDVVGPSYVPAQNAQVLGFFTEYLATDSMHIETAGSLANGRYIWALAKMHDGFTLAGGDQIDGYVLLMNPHIYGKGMIAKFTGVRVVCQNTMTAALGGSGKAVTLWHTTEFNQARQDEAKLRLGIAHERLEALKHDAEVLAGTKLEFLEAMTLAAEFMGVTEDKREQPLEEQPRAVQRVLELWQGEAKGADLKSAHETAWGLLQATTQYYDWEYGRTAQRRLQQSWDGISERVKRRAQEVLVAAAVKKAA